MAESFQVVCVGVITIDALALVERYPGADERVVGEDVMIAGGGPAANAAVVLARQGVPVAFVGRVGKDQAGEQAVRLLEQEGVDVSGVLFDAAARTQTSCVIVSRESQSRAISTLAIPPLPPLEQFGAHAMDLVTNAQWVHTDHLGFAPIAGFFSGTGRKQRPKVAVDAGNPIAGFDWSVIDLHVPTTESLVRQFDLEHTPENIEKAARQAMEKGVAAVVATQGSRGSHAWWQSKITSGTDSGKASAPAIDGINIKSTLGAGDVFHGALLSALCRNCDWPTALIQANATAALSCRALDGRSAVPSLDELMRFVGEKTGEKS